MPNPDYPFINLREELNDIFKDHFSWFGLRQPDRSKRCSCYSNTSVGLSAPDKTCRRCLGSGYKFTDYIIRGYSWLGILGFEYPSGPGPITTQTNNLIVEWNKAINKSDIILLLDQEASSSKLKTPFRILKQYVVQDSKPIRLDDARIEFWRCQLEERSITDYTAGEEGTNFTYKGNRSNVDPV